MGRKPKPLLTIQPKLADVKFGMGLCCACPGMAIQTEAISAALHSKGILDKRILRYYEARQSSLPDGDLTARSCPLYHRASPNPRIGVKAGFRSVPLSGGGNFGDKPEP